MCPKQFVPHFLSLGVLILDSSSIRSFEIIWKERIYSKKTKITCFECCLNVLVHFGLNPKSSVTYWKSGLDVFYAFESNYGIL